MRYRTTEEEVNGVRRAVVDDIVIELMATRGAWTVLDDAKKGNPVFQQNIARAQVPCVDMFHDVIQAFSVCLTWLAY
jgi:hypothetical protein